MTAFGGAIIALLFSRQRYLKYLNKFAQLHWALKLISVRCRSLDVRVLSAGWCSFFSQLLLFSKLIRYDCRIVPCKTDQELRDVNTRTVLN